jgi:hypothetical protein
MPNFALEPGFRIWPFLAGFDRHCFAGELVDWNCEVWWAQQGLNL